MLHSCQNASFTRHLLPPLLLALALSVIINTINTQTAENPLENKANPTVMLASEPAAQAQIEAEGHGKGGQVAGNVRAMKWPSRSKHARNGHTRRMRLKEEEGRRG